MGKRIGRRDNMATILKPSCTILTKFGKSIGISAMFLTTKEPWGHPKKKI